jgi:SAM-dependent methyltransferase
MSTPHPAPGSAHWDEVYRGKPADQVSWYQPSATTSLRLLAPVLGPAAATRSVVDVGAGASVLVDGLLDAGCRDVTLVDVSEEGLNLARRRLGARAGVTYVVADVRTWRPGRTFDAWHDRAVFHFLTDPADQAAYVATAAAVVAPGGVLVLGAFAEDGPESCSGLPTARHSVHRLGELFAEGFEPDVGERERHVTPWGTEQSFSWVRLRRR